MTFRITVTLILIACSYVWCSAQKIKVKDGQVFLDDKEVLKIQMVEYDNMKNWYVLTPIGDTVVTFVRKRLELTLLPHELYKRKYNYYEVRFNDSDEVGYLDQYSINTPRSIAEMLRGCFKDGKYAGGCANAVIDKSSDWSAGRMSDIQSANKRRDSLTNDEEYLKYSAALVKRNASLTLEILPDSSVMVFNVKIGRFHLLTAGSVSTSYRVLNEKNKPIATVNYEHGRNRVFIRTINDNAGKEYFIDRSFGQNDVYDAVAYLVDYGYL